MINAHAGLLYSLVIHAVSRLCVLEDGRQRAMWERDPTLVVSVVSAWAENRIDAAAAAAAVAFFNSNEKSYISAVSFCCFFLEN